jgi:protein ImuB
VDRTACVDVPAFPLQLLLQRRQEWAVLPVAVVAEDRPHGVVLWVNERARGAGVLPGMRYAAALSLVPDLRAAVVPEDEVRDEVDALAERLRQFTPHVEPSRDEPGVFWLDARGLERLFGCLDAWASSLHADLARAGFQGSVAVGFRRFGVYAVARARRGARVLMTLDEERRAARAVPLARLAMPPVVRDLLAKLGVRTVGEFVDLPVDGVGVRFGPEVEALHRAAAGDLDPPLQPERPAVPAVRRLVLEPPDHDAARLVAAVETLLGPLLGEVTAKGHLLAELQMGFRFERLGDHVEGIRPAAPTLDPKRLMELVRLRLEAVRRLPDAVAEIVLVAREVEPEPRQRELFARERQRDLDAANRALARVRARFGDAAVERARLREGHLPEGRFAWEALPALAEARPRGADEPRLVRRIHARPVPLPPRERHEPDGWMLRGLEQGPVVRVLGPYVISGGWWARLTHRDYHFAETRQGELLWVFYDRTRRRWFLQGRVE